MFLGLYSEQNFIVGDFIFNHSNTTIPLAFIFKLYPN